MEKHFWITAFKSIKVIVIKRKRNCKIFVFEEKEKYILLIIGTNKKSMCVCVN